jgi:hypothetical protein
MAKETKKCAHPGCQCHAREDSNYCGTWCEGAAGTPEVLCNCGHASCVTDAAV